MQVRQLMTTALATVRPDAPILDAGQLMHVERIRHLLVTSAEGWFRGIVTDRDIRLHVPSTDHLPGVTVGQVMSTSLVTIGPERDATEAARLMLVHKIGARPVIHGGRPIGIVTQSDFVRAFAQMAGAPPTA